MRTQSPGGAGGPRSTCRQVTALPRVRSGSLLGTGADLGWGRGLSKALPKSSAQMDPGPNLNTALHVWESLGL